MKKAKGIGIFILLPLIIIIYLFIDYFKSDEKEKQILDSLREKWIKKSVDPLADGSHVNQSASVDALYNVAQALIDAKGMFNDDEDLLWNNLSALKTYDDWKIINIYFNLNGLPIVLDYWFPNLNQSEQLRLLNILEGLHE